MIRAKIEGKYVFGWYYEDDVDSDGLKPFIMPSCNKFKQWGDCIRIPDLSLCAESTGRKDKTGKEIYGSKGEMQGGDRVRLDGVEDAVGINWNPHHLYWGCPMATQLGQWLSDELEILPEKEAE